MIRIEYNKIFRIANDGVYYDDGKLEFADLQEENGYHGEEQLGEGEFVIKFYGKDKFCIVFPFNAFGDKQNAVKSARAKMGSCSLFLNSEGVLIKELQI